jgi:aryl-alcohol dehydrogenase-like predicted oxidoreductase
MIPTMAFGRTGHLSSRTIFGAAALARVGQEEADRTMETVLRYGVNHLDVAASYGDAEIRLGPWMPRHRREFFLATKTGKRTYAEAKEEIHRSLERLQTDQIDLIQLHNLAQEEEWQTALGPGGALEAAVEAREQGLVRFIGVTGHGVGIAAMHRRSLGRFDFDAVLLPYSYMMMRNPQYAADVEALLAICAERNVAVQTIKGITRRPWPDETRSAATWYDPLRNQEDIDLAAGWVLGNPQVFLNTAGDIDLLPRTFEAASHLGARPSVVRMDELLRRQEMVPLFV